MTTSLHKRKNPVCVRLYILNVYSFEFLILKNRLSILNASNSIYLHSRFFDNNDHVQRDLHVNVYSPPVNQWLNTPSDCLCQSYIACTVYISFDAFLNALLYSSYDIFLFMVELLQRSMWMNIRVTCIIAHECDPSFDLYRWILGNGVSRERVFRKNMFQVHTRWWNLQLQLHVAADVACNSCIWHELANTRCRNLRARVREFCGIDLGIHACESLVIEYQRYLIRAVVDKISKIVKIVHLIVILFKIQTTKLAVCGAQTAPSVQGNTVVARRNCLMSHSRGAKGFGVLKLLHVTSKHSVHRWHGGNNPSFDFIIHETKHTYLITYLILQLRSKAYFHSTRVNYTAMYDSLRKIKADEASADNMPRSQLNPTWHESIQSLTNILQLYTECIIFRRMK